MRSSGGADSERAAGLERQSRLRSVELPLLFLRELLPPGHQREVVRDKIYGITTCEGVGNCWLAVNIDNYFNMSVLFFAGADRQSIELSRIPKLKELVAAQPLAAAQFFTHFCDAILEHLFGGIGTGRRGVVGTLPALIRVYDLPDTYAPAAT